MTLPNYALNQRSFPEMYERWLVRPLFLPWAELTLDELKLSRGERFLDIACGTGIVARVAKERLGDTGHVVGVDLSPDMLATARAVAPDIDWREGNASSLPLKDGEQFDVVVCQQGLQFFTEKTQAIAEMRRALAEHGRLAVATWRSDDEMPFLRELRYVAERHLGGINDQRYAFGDAALLEVLLRDAGFQDIDVKTVARTIRFDEGEIFIRLNTMAFVGMSTAGKTMSDEERKRVMESIVEESAPVLQRYSDESGLAFELSTNLAIATR
ncbi:MAG TPA: methyltransferase domain-containing protein [Pyrinomonadaceae bacterium]